MSYEPTVWVDGDHVTSAKLNKLEQGVNSMSYTPTVWNAGDVVTAEKLNKLEQGVAEGGGGGGGDYPTFTLSYESMEFVSGTCDMTFAECKALCTEEYAYTHPCICIYYDDGEETQKSYDYIHYMGDDDGIFFGSFNYSADGTITYEDR